MDTSGTCLDSNAFESELIDANNDGRTLVRRWRGAGPELEAIKRHEAAVVEIQEAIRQIFDGMESVLTTPLQMPSVFVEQQMWFSRIRAGSANPSPAKYNKST